jgi:hypothetical protein
MHTRKFACLRPPTKWWFDRRPIDMQPFTDYTVSVYADLHVASSSAFPRTPRKGN